MALQTTGRITIGNIKNILGGAATENRLSHYYNNASTGYIRNDTTIPSSGLIRFSQLYGKGGVVNYPP
jgi:hypothetical protein